jgi:small-conductance mechanosensitive channel
MNIVNHFVCRLRGPVLALSIAIIFTVYVEALHVALGVVAISLAPMEQAIELGVWLAGAVLFNRLLTLVFWDSFVVKTLGRSAPRLIIQLTSVLVFLIAASGVLRFVFDQSIAALWATSGAIGIVVGLALKNLILDTFSGLAIHLERPFKVGDWINCHTRMGEYIGRVEETNWRTTRLWTTGPNRV